MDPEQAALVDEVRRFKSMFAGNIPAPGPNFSYLEQFPKITAYLKSHGVFPPEVFNDSDREGDSDSDPEEPEYEENEDDGYLSNPEFDEEEEDEDGMDLFDLDDVNHPGFNMDNWLADYAALGNNEEPEQNPEQPPPESEPESEVENPEPPTVRTIGMRLPNWGPSVQGYTMDLQAGTYVYVEIAPIIPCFWKEHDHRYYLGPVRLTAPCVDLYYTIELPHGYSVAMSDKVLYCRVTRIRPTDDRRIVSLHLDFSNERTYTELPVFKEVYLDPSGERHWDQRWKVTWRCFGLTEVTVERESTLRLYYPWFF